MPGGFRDRQDGGEQLAHALSKWANTPNTIILTLPRGGVVIGAVIAQRLHLPLDIVVPRKIGAPENPEFAIGAITEEGEGVFDHATIEQYRISDDYMNTEIKKEQAEAKRRLRTYRGKRPPLHLQGKTAIVVDDGIATGATMKAALQSVRQRGAKKIIVAVPVAPTDSIDHIRPFADEIICLHTPELFFAVGQWYDVFDQVSDGEVISLLAKSYSNQSKQ